MSWLTELRRPAGPSDHQSILPSARQQQQTGQTPSNQILFQTFEWHTQSNPPSPKDTQSAHSHYSRLYRLLPQIRDLGVTAIWVPPGCKANSPQGNGYDCYDLWDLGEFDQKWTRSTKWGSREELGNLVRLAHELKIEVIWDAVLNHKTAGDATEECWAVEVDKEDRRIEICQPKKIEAWIKYEFPGRHGKYSSLRWRAEHFNGTDWDQRAEKNAIYKIIDDPATYPKPTRADMQSQNASFATGLNRLTRLAGKMTGTPVRRPGKGWADDVDDLHGNFDYLMFSNIDYTHPAVREDTMNWGQWMINETDIDGFRLDAVQHFSYKFTHDWITLIQEASRAKRRKNAFVVGEIWTGEVHRIVSWLDVVGQGTYAYDAPLLYNFSRISQDVVRGSKNADLRTILRGSLLSTRPQAAVTLVTNHDTQPGQSSYTPVDACLKALFYAFILLRHDGYPCVFWGDMFGTRGPLAEQPSCVSPATKRSQLPDLMLARRLFAYGEQTDYFESASCIGWTRAGTQDRPGCAVVLSIGRSKSLAQMKMKIGSAGEVWTDLLSPPAESSEVVIDGKGSGNFALMGTGVGVFVRKGDEELRNFPARMPLESVGH